MTGEIHEDNWMMLYAVVSGKDGPVEPFVLMRGDDEVLVGTYAECMLWLTRHLAQPILQSALEQGYHIEPWENHANPKATA